MELVLFAAVLATVVLVLCREMLPAGRFRGRRRRSRLPHLAASSWPPAGSRPPKMPIQRKPPADRVEGQPVAKKLVKPPNWPADHPLPLVGSNCAACHLTAGRELTAAVVNFVRSVHDLQEMTCYDCHGGNAVDDVKAHYEDFGFIGTKKSAHIATCSECHSEAAEALAAGPHHWDFSERINTEYPMCFDCHGNHDIGNAAGRLQAPGLVLRLPRNGRQGFPQSALCRRSKMTSSGRPWARFAASASASREPMPGRVPRRRRRTAQRNNAARAHLAGNLRRRGQGNQRPRGKASHASSRSG